MAAKKMFENWRKTEDEASTNYWPAVADMATATCVLLIIFWIAGTWALQKEHERGDDLEDDLTIHTEERKRLEVLVAQLQSELDKLNDRLNVLLKGMEGGKKNITSLLQERELLKKQIAGMKEEIKRYESALVGSGSVPQLKKEKLDLERRLRELLASFERTKKNLIALQELHKEPPNIVLSDGKNYTFSPGKANVSSDFDKRFRANEIDKIIEALNHTSNVEIVEIVGHTDRQRVSGGSSNLDEYLNDVFAGKKSTDVLRYSSNTDLGMARAIAVKKLIEACLVDIEKSNDSGLTDTGHKRLAKLVFRTYSAGQLFPASSPQFSLENEGDASSDDIEEDRRIEIRFTRFKDSESDQGLSKDKEIFEGFPLRGK